MSYCTAEELRLYLGGPREKSRKEKNEEGGEIELDFTDRTGTRNQFVCTRIEAIGYLLGVANQEAENSIDQILNAEPDGATPRDGSETKACRHGIPCGNAAGCVYQQIVNPVVMYGAALLEKAGHCISLPNLLQDYMEIIIAKGG